MAASDDPFEYLDDMPISQWFYMPKPLNHPDDPNKIIISTYSHDSQPGIYEFDLISNKLTKPHG